MFLLFFHDFLHFRLGCFDGDVQRSFACEDFETGIRFRLFPCAAACESAPPWESFPAGVVGFPVDERAFIPFRDFEVRGKSDSRKNRKAP